MKLTIVDPLYNNSLIDYVDTKCRSKGCTAFRFYTLLMYGIPVDNLIPRPDVIQILNTIDYSSDEGTKAFDIAYANQLLYDKFSFVDFMQIMSSLQNCEETFILSNYKNQFVAQILDSMIKLIQERYSIQTYIVNEIEDINELAVSDFSSQEGYQAYIADLDRFNMIYKTKEQLSQEVF